MGIVRIAVIDNGVDEDYIKGNLEHKIFVNEKGRCIDDHTNRKQIGFLHGTICAMLIEKYFPACRISSVRVLNENGMGLLESLTPALEWCLENEISIINLSFGSTFFKDRDRTRALINYYANKGLYIVAATANSGYVSYPAALANVIGVARDTGECPGGIRYRHLGIDLLAPVESEVVIGGKRIEIQKSNSYAAPFVTSAIGKLSLDMDKHSISKLKRALLSQTEGKTKQLRDQCLAPDWISSALVRIHKKKSMADYYFKSVYGAIHEAADWVDTIVTDDLSDFDEIALFDKNIVFLGTEKVERNQGNLFFWSSQIRLKQVLSCTDQVENLDLPLILCELTDDIDEMFLLTEMRKCFFEDGYHLYTVSFQTESVLFDLEYLPAEILEPENKISFDSIVYGQTYYKQCDALFIGVEEHLVDRAKQLVASADLLIKFETNKQEDKITILMEGLVVWENIYQNIDKEFVQSLFHKIKILFSGDVKGQSSHQSCS